MRRAGRVWGALLLAWLALPLWAARAQSVAIAETESYVLARGVVVDRAAALVYVLLPEGRGGIEALDATTLRSRARSTQAVMPLLVSGERLLALAAVGAPLRLTWLQTRSLAVLRPCTPISVPRFAQPGPVDGLGSSFTLSADQQGDQIFVRWSAHTAYVGGVPPSPQQQRAATRDASGVVRVDAQSGALVPVAHPPADASPKAYGMEVPYNAGPFLRDGLEIRVSTAGDASSVLVKRRRIADRSDLPVLRIAAPASLGIVALDGRYLLVPQPMVGASFASARLWSLAEGRELARIALSDCPTTFVVVADQLLFVAQDRLFSVPLNGAARRAQRQLRATDYRGTYPPSAPGGPARDEMPP
jgi:hypothetical protein